MTFQIFSLLSLMKILRLFFNLIFTSCLKRIFELDWDYYSVSITFQCRQLLNCSTVRIWLNWLWLICLTTFSNLATSLSGFDKFLDYSFTLRISNYSALVTFWVLALFGFVYYSVDSVFTHLNVDLCSWLSVDLLFEVLKSNNENFTVQHF